MGRRVDAAPLFSLLAGAGVVTSLLLSACGPSAASSSTATDQEAPAAAVWDAPLQPAAAAVAYTGIAVASANLLSPQAASRVYAFTELAALRAHRAAPEGQKEAAAAVAAAHVGEHLFAHSPRSIREWQSLPDRYRGADAQTEELAMEVAATVIEQADAGYQEALEALADPPVNSDWDWQPTGNSNSPADTPNWGALDTISSAGSCTLPYPDLALLEAQAREMFTAYSPPETADPIVLLWLAGPGSATPAGYWLQMATRAAQEQNLNAGVSTELIAAAAISGYDTSIVAWREKFRHSIARPETMWEIWTGERPRMVRETPAHPSYPSGHASFSGAGARTITSFVGDVPVTLTMPADNGVLPEQREYDNADTAAQEAAQSRVTAAFHYAEDGRAGIELGHCVADAVMQYLQEAK